MSDAIFFPLVLGYSFHSLSFHFPTRSGPFAIIRINCNHFISFISCDILCHSVATNCLVYDVLATQLALKYSLNWMTTTSATINGRWRQRCDANHIKCMCTHHIRSKIIMSAQQHRDHEEKGRLERNAWKKKRFIIISRSKRVHLTKWRYNEMMRKFFAVI